MLCELIDNSRTDKNTTHSYRDLYQTLLVGKKETAVNVLHLLTFQMPIFAFI